MAEYSKELNQNTIEVWSPKYGYTLSEDEAVEIIYNLTRYFETKRNSRLIYIGKAEKKTLKKRFLSHLFQQLSIKPSVVYSHENTVLAG